MSSYRADKCKYHRFTGWLQSLRRDLQCNALARLEDVKLIPGVSLLYDVVPDHVLLDPQGVA